MNDGTDDALEGNETDAGWSIGSRDFISVAVMLGSVESFAWAV